MDNQAELIGYKDRKLGLVIFGIFEIILGAFCALMAPLMIIGMFAAATLKRGSGPALNAGMMIPGLVIYVLFAVWFIWMGIGSIMARRWARALVLVTSWFWFISGVIGLVFMLVFLPGMYDQMGKSGQVPREIAMIIKFVTIGFMMIFYVIVPGVLVLFYGSKHVKATCEYRDPQVRWTDKCPLPVLAVSLISGLCAASMLLMGFYGWAIPFFGFILSGPTGAVVALASLVLLSYVAWGTYRLKVETWWCAVLLVMAWGVSSVITFSRVSLIELYEKMKLPSDQLELIRNTALAHTYWMVLFCGLWVLVAMAYLLYTKRYFMAKEETHV